LDRLEQHPAGDIVMFSHGQYLNAVAWLLEKKPRVLDGQAMDGQAMADWRAYEIANHIQNAGGFSLSRSAGDAVWALGTRDH